MAHSKAFPATIISLIDSKFIRCRDNSARRLIFKKLAVRKVLKQNGAKFENATEVSYFVAQYVKLMTILETEL